MKKYIVCNWKMNGSKQLIEDFSRTFTNKNFTEQLEIAICPPFLLIPYLVEAIKKNEVNIVIGAQDCHQEVSGAYTGEIDAQMLRDIGCKYAIVGHSERRRYYSETNELIKQKAEIAISREIIPIFCIGEQETHEKEEVLQKQCSFLPQSGEFMIAYEPIFAIGTGIIPTNAQIEDAIKIIRRYSTQPVLYGGSVNATNIHALQKVKDLSGFLVGNASLNVNELLRIAKSVSHELRL